MIKTLLRIIALLVFAAAMMATAGAQTLVPVSVTGDSVNRVDFLIIGDGYTGAEMSTFASDVDTIVSQIMSDSFFGEYRNYFNFRRLDVPSVDSGASHPNNGINKNTAVGAFYDCHGIERALCVDWGKLSALLSQVPPEQRDMVVVLVNDPEYGGTGGAVTVMSHRLDTAADVFMHEAGHTFGLLADEYWGDSGDQTCNFEPAQPNVTAQTDRTKIKWRIWIDPATEIPTTTRQDGVPGLYEGGDECAYGMYRPVLFSKMFTLGLPFYQINTEQLVKRLYVFTDPVESYLPASATVLVNPGEAQTFSVTLTAPATHSLDVSWTLDGMAQAPQASPLEFVVGAGTLALGHHTLTANTADNTPWVRNDPEHLLHNSISWDLNVSVTDFALVPGSALQAGLSTTPTGSVSGTLTLQRGPSHTAPVTLTCSVAPAGPACNVSPATLTSATAATLTVTTANTNAGLYTVTLTGSDGTNTHTLTTKVRVMNFTVVVPSQMGVIYRSSNITQIGAQRLQGYAGSINLSCSVAPAGPACAFSPSTLGPQDYVSSLTVNAGSASPGVYTITVTASDGTLTHSASFPLNIQTFSLAPSAQLQAGLVLARTADVSSTFTIQRQLGHNANVTFRCTAAPAGPGCWTDPYQTTLQQDVTLEVSSGNKTGNFVLTLTGSDGVNSVSFTVPVTVYPTPRAIPYMTSIQRSAATEDAVFDKDGNMYIGIDHVVKKINAVTGAETIFAGGGTPGCAAPDPNVNGSGNKYGDGCPAANATLYGVRGLATDLTYLYVVDESASQIHRIGLSDTPVTGLLYAHELELVAGRHGGGGWNGDGPQSDTAIHNPYNVALDAHGNVFFTDYNNQSIRMVDYSVTPPQVRTVVNSPNGSRPVAGCQTSAAGLTVTPATKAVINSPFGLTFDQSGNLYFVDKGCYSLRKVTPNPSTGVVDGTGTFSTVMGIGQKGTYPGPWFNTRGTPAFVGTLRSVSTTSRNPYSLLPNTNDLYISTSNGVWFYDSQNGWAHHIMKSAATLGCAANPVSPYTGCPAPQATFEAGGYAGRMSVDKYGNLYIVDRQNSRVTKVAIGTDFMGTAPQIPVGPQVTRTMLLHGFGACDQTIFTTSLPFAIGTYGCSVYGAGDQGTDWLLPISYYPSGNVYQSRPFTVREASVTTNFQLDGFGQGIQPLTVTCDSKTKAYNAPDPVFTFSTSLPVGTWLVPPTCVAREDNAVAGGRYQISVSNSGLAAVGFGPITSTSGWLTLTPGPVTATVLAGNKRYDATTAASIANCTLSGVLPRDVGSVSCTAAAASFASSTPGQNIPVTATGITLSGAAAANYFLTSTTATSAANILPVYYQAVPYMTSTQVASINGPQDVVVDRDGNQYIATYDRITRVDAVTGATSLFAGGLADSAPCANPDPSVNGSGNEWGDGCPAIFGYLRDVRGLAVDTKYLYIPGTHGAIHRVGLANTPLPGQLYAHELEQVAAPEDASHPYGIAVDAHGNLFWGTHWSSSRVLMADYSAGNPPVIRTVVNSAGNGGCQGVAPHPDFTVTPATNAVFGDIYGLTFDQDGNLYFVDKPCYSVRKVTPNAAGIVDGTGTFSTLIGNGTKGTYGGPWYYTLGAPAFIGTLRSITTAGRDANTLHSNTNNLYISTTKGIWFYDSGTGWAHYIMKSVPDDQLGCAANPDAPYVGCPAPHAMFSGSNNGARMNVDQYGNLYIADGADNQVTKVAIGLDFAGTAPVKQVDPHSPATQLALVHGGGVCGSLAFAADPPFAAGTPSCNVYAGSGDQGTDWVVPIQFTPIYNGYQSAWLTEYGIAAYLLRMDGIGVNAPARTVTCSNAAKTYGNADPAFTFTTDYPVSSWTVAPICAAPLQGGVAGSPYAIYVMNCASLAAPGLGPFTCKPGSLTVTPRPITATVTVANKLYDGNTTAVIASCTPNVLPADRGNVTCSASAASFASVAAANGVTVTATGIALAGAAAVNYTPPATAATTADILQAEKIIPYMTSKQRAVASEDVVFDRAGNMYVIAGTQVKKIDATTGAESVFAAASTPSGCAHPDTGVNGGGDKYGDGCPATNAFPWEIRSMAVDLTYLYVADEHNSQIHRIGLSDSPLPGRRYAHELERVAGGDGGGAWSEDGPQAGRHIHNPEGVAVDARGNVFWADTTSHAIRMMDYSVNPPRMRTVVNYPNSPPWPVPGCQTTTSGLTVTPSRAAVISNPYGLTFDQDGNLYFVDKVCYSLRKVTPNPATGIVDGTGTFSTILGNGKKGTYQGPWYNTRGTPAFVGTLRSVTTVSRDPNTLVSNSRDLYISTSNGMWFYDARSGWAHHIMKSASALGCAASSTSPYTGCPAPQATFAGGSTGARMSVDQYGNLYVADQQNAQVTKLALGTDFVGTAPSVRSEVNRETTQTVLIHGSGTCGTPFASTYPFTVGTPACAPYTTGDLGADWALPLTLNPPTVGPQSGILLIAGANVSVPLDGYGGVSAKVLPYMTARQHIGATEDLVFDRDGNLYVIDADRVKKVDAVNGAETVFAGGGWRCANPDTSVNGGGNSYGDGCPATNGVFAGIRSLAADRTYLYIADENASQIHRIGLSSSPLPGRRYAHELELVAGLRGGGGWNGDGPQATTRIHNPYGLAVDAHGNVFWSDRTSHAIRMVDYSATPPQVRTVVNFPQGAYPAEGCQTAASGLTVTPARNAAISKPYGLTFDQNGNLYFVDKGCYSLRKVTPNPATGVVDGTGTFSTLIGNGMKGTYPGPWYNTLGTAAFAGTLRSVTTTGRDPNTLVPNSNDLYVSTTNGVWFYDAQSGWAHHILKSETALGCADNFYSPFLGCPAPYSTFAGASGGARMAVDQYGNLYLADWGNSGVTKVATGADFIGTAPAASVALHTTSTQKMLVHGLGSCAGATVSTDPPWAVSKLSCSTYAAGDGQTDWILSTRFTPTAAGVQSGLLTVGKAGIPLDGKGVAP